MKELLITQAKFPSTCQSNYLKFGKIKLVFKLVRSNWFAT